MKSVLCFGEALLVVVPESQGPLADVRGFQLQVAGAELNTAVGLSRLQIPSEFAGSVGADALGDKVVKTLRAEGVGTSLLEQSPEAPSPLFVKERLGLSPQTHVYYYRNQSPMAKGWWKAESSLKEALNQRFSWGHTTGITWALGERCQDTAARLLQGLHRAGTKTSFDINMRLKMQPVSEWKNILKAVLPWCDWIFLSDEEAELLLAEGDAVAVERQLRDQGFKGQGIVLKAGDKGAWASVQGQRESVAAWPGVRVVDTVGAGDGFNAGFIAAQLRELSLPQSLRLGALIGAYAVTVAGDFEGYPTWEAASMDLQGAAKGLR